MATVLEELITVLGFELDDEDLKRFNKLTDIAGNTLKKIALAGTAAAAGFGVYINSVSTATDDTFKFAKTVGASFQEVQKLTHATEIWGGTADDVMSSLRGLAAITSKATRGAGGGEIFGILGISPTGPGGGPKNTVALLKEIADNMDRMGDEARQLDLLGQLGISENMILLLRKGSAGIEEIGDEVERFGFVLSDKQGVIAEDFIDATVRAKLVVRSLGNEIGLRLMPRMTELIDRFIQWRAANRDIIDSNITRFVETFEKAARPLAISVAIISAGLLIWAIAANAIAAGFVAVASAVGLVIDDVTKFMNGEGGTFAEKFLGDVKTTGESAEVRALTDFFKDKLIKFDQFINLGVFSDGRAESQFDPLTNNSTTISPTFNIRSTDPIGVSREVNGILTDLWGGSQMVS